MIDTDRLTNDETMIRKAAVRDHRAMVTSWPHLFHDTALGLRGPRAAPVPNTHLPAWLNAHVGEREVA